MSVFDISFRADELKRGDFIYYGEQNYLILKVELSKDFIEYIIGTHIRQCDVSYFDGCTSHKAIFKKAQND